MDKLKISVVVPVYNTAHVLNRCLVHLVHQTYKNLEIIIVDDGSTDASADIYSGYAKKDKRIKIIRQKNSGPANARNAGIMAATGEYIHFCDSDDFVELDYYERMVAAAVLTNADIVCGSVDEKGFFFPEFHKIQIYTDLRDKISVTVSYYFHVVWRFLYRREFLIDNGILFPLNCFWGEDTRFMFQALYHSNILATACDAVYHCVDNPTSLGKNIGNLLKTKKNGNDTDLKKYQKFLSDSGIKNMIDDMRKNGVVTGTRVLEIFKIPMLSIKYLINGGKKWVMFGVPVLHKKVTPTKIRWYLFGLYLWRTYYK